MFLGSIILKKDDKLSQDKITYKTVIDGQQRLTTLTILLKALFDSDNGTSPVDEDEEYLFYVETIKTPEGKKINKTKKIINSRVDKALFLGLKSLWRCVREKKSITMLRGNMFKNLTIDGKILLWQTRKQVYSQS